MLLYALQLRNISQHIDNYLNKPGKREGENYFFDHHCYFCFLLFFVWI